MDKEKKNSYKIKISEDLEQGTYANAISVHINKNECIIDMGYSIPNSPEATIKIVSRVNMSHATAESFLKVLTNAILDWKNKENSKK